MNATAPVPVPVSVSASASVPRSTPNLSFAWRLLTWDLLQSLPASASSAFTQAQLMQLRALFLHFDEDRDGFLTTDELSTALSELGFQPRERLLKKFCSNATQLKVQGLSTMAFKTDCKTFMHIITKEIEQLRTTAAELTTLFEFVDERKTGFLSKQDLRFLLVELESPTRLSPQEYQRFIRNLTFSSDGESVNIEHLKHQMLFYHFH